MDSEEEISEFEKIRNESVRIFNEMLEAELGIDIQKSVTQFNEVAKSLKKEKPERPKVAAKRRVNRTGRLNLAKMLPKRKSNRIANKGNVSYADMDDTNDSDEKENYEVPAEEIVTYRKKMTHRRTRSSAAPPDPSIITEEYISKVIYTTSTKLYCPKTGSSCHQCRQKTKDSKTICKSSRCVGVRGQFCGICLQNRYGENAAEALRNPKWVCPPCRGICNCSICRTRQGKRPTGILTPTAQAQGHKSVKDYLISLKDLGLDEVEERKEVTYTGGDVIGFSEAGGAYILPEVDDDEIMGFHLDDAIMIDAGSELPELKSEDLEVLQYK